MNFSTYSFGQHEVHYCEVDAENTEIAGSFFLDAIERTKKLNDNLSAIVLKSGFEILVTMPWEEMKEKIYRPALKPGDIVDLKAVTGRAVEKDLYGDGVEIGVSPDTGRVFYAAPQDEQDKKGQRLRLNYNQAAAHVVQKNKEKYLGFNDWRVPTDAELAMLNKHQRKLNIQEGAMYWSSTPYRGESGTYFARKISSNYQDWHHFTVSLSVQFVRG